jgi:hypothetical protein
MLNINLKKEREMITLTDKENLLAQELIETTDGTDAHICHQDFINIKTLGFDVSTLKGVFGSLVQKGLLFYNHTNDNGEIYRWSVPVDEEQQNHKFNKKMYDIKNVSDLLFQIEKQKEERG